MSEFGDEAGSDEDDVDESTSMENSSQQRLADQFSLENAFNQIDEDHDGKIDLNEFRNALSKANATEEDITKFQEFMERLDEDHSGKIEKKEFEKWWRSNNADLDGDGNVDDVEAALRNLKLRAKKKYHVDIFTACWEGQSDVVERFLLEDPDLVYAAYLFVPTSKHSCLSIIRCEHRTPRTMEIAIPLCTMLHTMAIRTRAGHSHQCSQNKKLWSLCSSQ